jgi:hypothetical protein
VFFRSRYGNRNASAATKIFWPSLWKFLRRADGELASGLGTLCAPGAVSALFAPDSRDSIVQSDSLSSGRMLSPTKKKTKMFHASMKVTRLEEWCVEAETPDQARALLESGAGHRLCIGECLDVELEQLLED